MKARRTPSQPAAHARALPPKDGSQPAIEHGSIPQSRRWWFRILAALLPILLLGLAELGLRLADYGSNTSFFLECGQSGRTLLVENPKFGWRFFPPAIARTPQPLSLAADKPAGTIRIFVFGESAAMGDPDPSFGFPRQLEQMLAACEPSHKFEVVNTAMTAINSHVIREIARDCAPRHGDFWVVYAGNNEVVGPFGAGTVFGRQAPRLAIVRASLLVKSTRLGQWLDSFRARSADPLEWQGMEMFLQNQVRRDDPGMQIVTENFARNLEAIVELGQHSGARVLLATVPVNLKDSPPFASQHRPDLSAAELDAWEKYFGRGRAAQEAGRFADALAAYNEAGQVDAEFAELPFRQAVCELALNQTNAVSNFLLARDLDTLRFRADSRINQTIRRIAVARGATLIDAEQDCARHSPAGITGESLFYDHVHLNFAGNFLVAKLFAAEIEKKLTGPTLSASAPLLAEDEVARRLALTDFDRRRIGQEMRLRLQQPPFISQLNSKSRDEEWQETLNRLEAPPERFVGEYQAALKLVPDDWVIHADFGRLLEAAGDEPAANLQWHEVARLMPHEPDAWFQLGNLAYNARSFAGAQAFFQEALQRKPDLLEALNGLGLSLAAQGQAEKAILKFRAALQLVPSYSAARVNLAVALADRGEIPAAMAEYRAVLHYETNHVAARINLAKLLAGQGETDEAILLFKQALELNPEEPVANFDLANALVAQGRHAEAIPYYRAATLAEPDFSDARFNLAMESARVGDLAEALPQFAEVVRLQPNLANARFNYGIALAKQKRYAEAVKQFQETLKLQPDNAAAKDALERALKLAKSP
ncbi:MAG: tetratricopeptide repeat protein [Verrucomicrobiota bacterium]